MNRQERKRLGRIQDLIGRASGAYADDRSPDRAEKVNTALSEAFDLAVKMLSKYPPEELDQ